MGFFQDMKSVFTKKELVFLESYKEVDGVFSFLFEKEKDLAWKAGQHALFTITHRKVKNATKPFSVASAPAENVIKITTRISENPSEFKKAMLELDKGMNITMSGALGSFYLDDDSPSLLIAGGIGITPFRSMLKQLEAEGSSDGKQIKLLYLDRNNKHIYNAELDEIAKNTSITVTYLDSRDNLHKEMDDYTNHYKNETKYYIGPKSMVDSVSVYLKNKGIPKKNIRRDVLTGY
ncbi:Ferredoxin-NADP reductase [Oceanobacillus limi]|uniref:Ferredoxin-NADP reductase n=1 Tax=Oceanobacillus limi TaxID=930131 RepID=A0A1I0E3S0_9BACI|nr:FAD-dependent oxidoreductase [Oceanobacillus limi]SET38986.1 Ferredoxin-NADP reductase [Oceanobacillus limi]